jgi:hypothetical protein
MTATPDFSYTTAQGEADELIINITSHNLSDPSGRQISHMSHGMAAWMYEDGLDVNDLRYFLRYAHDVASVGEELGRMYEIQFDLGAAPDHLRKHDKKGRIWIEAAGPTSTMYFPDER